MTAEEGKNLLGLCLSKMDPTASIDSLIIYKYGNRKSCSMYQKDIITTKLEMTDYAKLKNGAKFVVKCFIHAEIYVAWDKSIGQGNGKYDVYKRELVKVENDHNFIFKDVLIGNGKTEHAYIFRSEKGICKFIQDVLLSGVSS